MWLHLWQSMDALWCDRKIPGNISMDQNELKQIAAQILAGLLANPHIYATISDEGANGQQEQILMRMAIDMAENLVQTLDKQ